MKYKNPVLLSTAYLPPLHYVGLMLAAPEVFIENHETYLKQSYRNRCEIYTANGKLALSIPVEKVNGNHTKTLDMKISEQTNWQILHWRAISSAYANSPFFLYYKDAIGIFFQEKYNSLLDFNTQLLIGILGLIGVKKQFIFTDKFEMNPKNVNDFRFSISPKIPPVIFNFQPYYQSFSEKHGFIPGLSILDVLFNMGPESAGVAMSTI
ncbi:MAG: WbqC family protein [Bacteroidales bacterium]|nr:WbqC family protein [Bacteroidales bacterium]